MAVDPLSRAFAALADPTRRDMVARLASADATVNELAEPYEVTLQAVSKHLKVLEDAGLVSRSRDAQRRPVHLEAQIFDLMTGWLERYRREAEERFSRLDEVLRTMSADDGSIADDSIAVGSSPVGSSPVGSSPVGSSPVGSTPDEGARS